MAHTLTSHDFLTEASSALSAPSPPQHRHRELTRRVRETFAGWPQMWALWQDVPMTPWGYPVSGAPFARGATGTPTDRLGGRDLPLYWNEVDLRGYRVLSKFLCDTNPFAIGILGRLTDYHIRKGYGWQACRHGAKKTAYPTVAVEDPVVEKAQRILDSFRNVSQWPLQSRSAFKRWRRAGEVFGLWGSGGWGKLPWFRFIDADQIGSPDGRIDTPQSFGIETDPDDILDVWSYHVWDTPDYPAGGEWMDASRIIHAKANVECDVKRGLPDFFPVQDSLDSVRKLLGNMIGTSAAQAAIAWREKFPTATAAQVQAVIPVMADERQNIPDGWFNRRPNHLDPASVIRTEGNREFEEGPTSAGVANFIEAEQACLRSVAVRFGIPESIATGKIDDVNFAASLTTNAPMAVAVEGTQFEWGAVWERPSALKVLDLATDAGLLTREERRLLDVEVTEPAIITPEPEKETNRRVALNRARVLSPQTWQLQEQLDPQHEAENWKAWDVANPKPEQGGDSGGGQWHREPGPAASV